MIKMKTLMGTVAWLSLMASVSAYAGVTSDEAAKLKTTLTPFGAEKAGNKDGTIPAWDGGLTKEIVPSTGSLPSDQFPNEKPLFVIDQKNVSQYADKLSDGQKALIAKYPNYHLTIYPSHRTFAAPQWVYDNNLKNAVNGQLTENGMSIKGVFGGVPFPIPKSGIELYWNHILRYTSRSNAVSAKNYTGNADGSVTMTVQAIDNHQNQYYAKDGNAEGWDGVYSLIRLQNIAPAFKAGEMLVVHDSIDPVTPRQAWQYLVGQRRVRRAPTVGYDTPDFVASGADYFDEVFGFHGAPDRYEWKLIGKKELYVPYNDNAFFQTPSEQVYTSYFPNADKLRWELHRVWEVEMTLASGKRHVVPKRRIYFDEDSYSMLLMDGYDAADKLWRTNELLPIDMPGYVYYSAAMIFNLQASTYSAVETYNDGYIKDMEPRPVSYFSGDSLASEGLR